MKLSLRATVPVELDDIPATSIATALKMASGTSITFNRSASGRYSRSIRACRSTSDLLRSESRLWHLASALISSGRVVAIDGCIACYLESGRIPLPGGRIYETRHWLVEHCRGPLGVGTLIVTPKRHIVRVAALEREEANELGGVLHAAAPAVDALIQTDQVSIVGFHASSTG